MIGHKIKKKILFEHMEVFVTLEINNTQVARDV
jgi:hypothetical protein